MPSSICLADNKRYGGAELVCIYQVVVSVD